jgi:isocitrate/isopropylmalate dehydrogenase
MKKIDSEAKRRTRRRGSLSWEGTARLCDRSLAELEAQGACLLGEADQAQTPSIVARDYSFLAPIRFRLACKSNIRSHRNCEQGASCQSLRETS